MSEKLPMEVGYINYDIIVTRSVGISFAARQIEFNRGELETIYSASFLNNIGIDAIILNGRKDFNIIKSIVLDHSDLKMIQERVEPYILGLGSDGIFGGLWSLGQQLNSGLVVDLNIIPISQQTLEVCEFLNLNPYMQDSQGSYLIVSALGTVFIEELEAAGVPAIVIGRLTKGKARIVRNSDEIRYLTPPKANAAKRT